jgi:pimeloyl-ACP methyl ester carboxylesterase
MASSAPNTVGRDVQVAMTLACIGYLGEGEPMSSKVQQMTAALARPDLPTARQWSIVWGPAEYETDLWFIAEGPNAQGGTTLALLVRGTQMKRFESIKQDLEPGLVALPFPAQGAPPNTQISYGFGRAFQRLLQAKSNGTDALTFLHRRLGPGPRLTDLHVIGHSLGGGLAPLVGLWLQNQFPQRKVSVYPFGGQSTGNAEFASIYEHTFANQPSRYITNLDITPLMFAGLGHLKFFWPNGPTPPRELIDLINDLRTLWMPYRATSNPFVFNAAMYPNEWPELLQWPRQVAHQHEHRYYLHLTGVPTSAIVGAFGPFAPPPISHDE